MPPLQAVRSAAAQWGIMFSRCPPGCPVVRPDVCPMLTSNHPMGPTTLSAGLRPALWPLHDGFQFSSCFVPAQPMLHRTHYVSPLSVTATGPVFCLSHAK